MTPDTVAGALSRHGYLPDEGISTAVFLAMTLQRPLLLEGEAGVGKTELAKTLASATGAQLIRLQCYEGIDISQAVYDWDYARQLLHLRATEATGESATRTADDLEAELYGERFLVKRALLRAIEPVEGPPPVLLIDEIDRADDEFEAYLLEVLSDFQITIPEVGVFRADRPPIVILTSNRTRDVHDALKRRCLYHWVEHPGFEREVAIVKLRVPGIEAASPGRWQAPSRRCGACRCTNHQGSRRPSTGRCVGTARRHGTRRAGGRQHAGHRREVPRGQPARRTARRGRPRAAGHRCRTRPSGGSRPAHHRRHVTEPATTPPSVPGPAATAPVAASPADIAVAFTQILRGLGLSVPTSCTHTFAAALCATGLEARDTTYWAGRSTLVRRMEDIALYDRAFAVFFEGRRSTGVEEPTEPLSITIAVDTDDDQADGDDGVRPTTR
jgi:hypothetical protein